VAGSVVVLAVFWLLLSGYFTPFLVAAGIGSAVAVALFARRMDVMDREGMPLHVALHALAYFPWLLKEIVKSGWDVTRIILHPALPISPTLVRFKPSQRTAIGLVTHANSITLTPGTLSVDVDADEFLVHALTAAGAAGVVDSEMDRRVAALESPADATVAPRGRA
jgi:multicomponent Na+:H+ antiporter subunit E